MSEKTAIGWCDHTFNPWWGCAHVSPGCVNCYAETLAKRYSQDVWGKSGDRRFFGDKHWEDPVKWNRKAEAEGVRRRVFCGSMMDVFEDREDLSDAQYRLVDLIEETPQLDWLLLTKRPENVPNIVPWGVVEPWPRNVWLGVSVEDQQRADDRVPKLLAIPAVIRFLSCEPLLGPVILSPAWIGLNEAGLPLTGSVYGIYSEGWIAPGFDYLHWVIVGGESGPKARPMNPAWARLLQMQCEQANVAFFAKQGSGRFSGQQYNLPKDIWAIKQWPKPPASLVAQGRLL